MQNLAVTRLVSDYHVFDSEFWLGYKTLEKFYPDFESIKMNLLKSKKVLDKYTALVPNYEVEKELLATEWKAKNEQAKADGVKTHEYIQSLLKSDPVACSREFQVPCNVNICDKLCGIDNGVFVEYRLEVPLDEDYTLVGVPDYFYIHDNVIDIKDWKTADAPIKFKAMYEMSKRQSKKMKYPLCLEDANGVHYQIQLSIYMWMLLQLRPDLQPGSLEIVWIKDNKVKKIYPVDYLGDKIDRFLKWHVKSLHLKTAMDACKEIEYGPELFS